MENYNPPFKITKEILSLVSLIMEKIGKLDSSNNLQQFPELREQNRIKSVHSSCAIEANSLSFDQVREVVNGRLIVGPKKDILEIKNAINAYNKITSINPLKEEDLKLIHSIFTKDLIIDSGAYRKGDEGVIDNEGNVIFIAPPPSFVKEHISNLFSWINKEYKALSPLILSSIFHYEFVFIHPFSDGNGRTARFWQNALLGKWKKIFYYLPIENEIHKHQKEYYEAINKSNSEGESTSFIIFMLNMINDTLDNTFKEIKTLTSSYSIYVNKLLNVLEKNRWYSANEILSLLNLKSKETLRKNYLNPLIKNELMILEYPNKPTSKNQRYKII